MLEELMQQKLLAHHAVVDSITVSQSEIDSKVKRSYRRNRFSNSKS
jgi:peptidyl-prolyl cis-trans isomerase SurA